jgi:hypothetical protein
MYKERRHSKANGCKCKSPALKDRPYCYYHIRVHKIAQKLSGIPMDEPVTKFAVPEVRAKRENPLEQPILQAPLLSDGLTVPRYKRIVAVVMSSC